MTTAPCTAAALLVVGHGGHWVVRNLDRYAIRLRMGYLEMTAQTHLSREGEVAFRVITYPFAAHGGSGDR